MIAASLWSLVAALLFVGALEVHPVLGWLVGGALARAAACAPTRWVGAAAGATFASAAAGIVHVPWVAAAAQQYFHIPPVTAWSAVLALDLGCGIMFGALLGVLLYGAVRRSACISVIIVGVVWSAWESLTTAVFPYYPWMALAATQTRLLPVVQVASIGGQAAASWAVATTGAAIGLGLAPPRSGGRRVGWRPQLLAAAVVLVAGVIAFGGWRLRETGSGARSACVVSTVDAGVTADERTDPGTLDRYERLTRAAFSHQPSVVVWPESALARSPQIDHSLLMRLRALATDGSTVLIAGGGRAGWDARWEPQRFNSVFRIAASGPVLHYDKQVAVPFAEYWPAPTGLQPVVFQTEGIESGRTTGIFDAGTCRLGVLICFEAEHAALARVAAHAGANVLIVASNDAVLPSRAIAYEVAQAQLRAIETGLAVVRAANRGVSLLIDPMGRIRQRGDQHVLRHDVPPPQPAIATHVAPWFLALCWSACAFAFQRCG